MDRENAKLTWEAGRQATDRLRPDMYEVTPRARMSEQQQSQGIGLQRWMERRRTIRQGWLFIYINPITHTSTACLRLIQETR